jgi:hypothetical protein
VMTGEGLLIETSNTGHALGHQEFALEAGRSLLFFFFGVCVYGTTG